MAGDAGRRSFSIDKDGGVDHSGQGVLKKALSSNVAKAADLAIKVSQGVLKGQVEGALHPYDQFRDEKFKPIREPRVQRDSFVAAIHSLVVDPKSDFGRYVRNVWQQQTHKAFDDADLQVVDQMAGLIWKESGKEHVNPFLIASIAKLESGFDPLAKKVTNGRLSDLGLMQLSAKENKDVLANDSWKDPMKNLVRGISVLKKKERFFKGNESLAVGAYNVKDKYIRASLARLVDKGTTASDDLHRDPEVGKALLYADQISRGGNEIADLASKLEKEEHPKHERYPKHEHAAGGVTTADHIALVHKDEAIIPLQKAPDIFAKTLQKVNGHESAPGHRGPPRDLKIAVHGAGGKEELRQMVIPLLRSELVSLFEEMSSAIDGGR